MILNGFTMAVMDKMKNILSNHILLSKHRKLIRNYKMIIKGILNLLAASPVNSGRLLCAKMSSLCVMAA